METKHAEAESNQLAAIVESSFDAIIGKTLEGRITSWNTAAIQMFGYRADEAIGQHIGMLIPADRAAEEDRILSRVVVGTKVPPFNTERLKKDGTRIQVSITVSPIRDNQGKIIGASKIARDISNLYRAELASRESEARLRFALESALVGDWDLQVATGQVRSSLRFDQCFGCQSFRGQWTTRDIVERVHPDDRTVLQDQLQRMVSDRHDLHVECRVVWPDESIRWISLHGHFRQENTMATQVVGIVADITSRKQVDEARINAHRLEVENLRIQEAAEHKSRFLASMSHELRTPLNAIIGFADLLESGALSQDTPEFKQFVGHITSGARHLLKLINDLLDLSKVEAGKFSFFPEPVDLEDLIGEVVALLLPTIVSKAIRIDWTVDDAVRDLVIDPARLKQILYNFLSNAIKFTPSAGLITVRASPQGPENFRVDVADTGIGIAADHIKLLFTDFQQLEGSHAKRHQGTGLGLALTRRLVQAQGGSVGVRSVLGEGSVFHFVLQRRHLPGPSL